MKEFLEVQRYSWLFDALVGLGFVLVLLFFWRFAAKKMYVWVLLPFALVAGYFMTEKMEVQIDAAGIKYSMFPAQMTANYIPREKVCGLNVSRKIIYNRTRTYRDVYTISDNNALYIYLCDKRVVVLGTQKREDLIRVLNNLGRVVDTEP